jgi:ribosomal protein L2
LGSYLNIYILVKLASNRHRLFFNESLCISGQNSNILSKFTNQRKAGVSRLLNIRPTVRGVAMNPIDHPHGGGEGKSSGGRHPVSP